jgi:tetratricopeptide (TPR) repeat protein
LTKVKVMALGNMGEAYYALHNYADAKGSYQAALALDPQSVHSWLGLGVVDQKSGDVAAAVQEYSRAVKLQPSDMGYLLLAQVLQQSGRSSEAQAATQQAKFVSQNLAAAQRKVDSLLSH